MIHWPLASVLNVTYAYLVESAERKDQTELLLSPSVKENSRGDLGRNREQLDAWLVSASGRLAAAEKTMMKELGGAA